MASDGNKLEKVGPVGHFQEEMVFGVRPLEEAILAGRAFDRIMIRKGIRMDSIRALMDLVTKHKIQVQQVPEAKLHSLTRHNHQGVIGFLSLVVYQKLEDVLERVISQGKAPLIVLLDRITDVRNFGAIARTAECAGADALVIPEKGAARINAEAMKASAGALVKIAVCRSPNIFKSAVSMLEQGFTLMSATEKGKQPYYEQQFQGPLCLILGSEEDGVSPPLLKMSTSLVTIPQYGDINSLNVSVAAGIILFEAAKQRSQK
jgi:23S rRNA (guanosine2251-2'-O)-methyltransferase